MSLSTPPPQYDQDEESQNRAQIDQELSSCLRNGQTVTFQAMDAVFVSPNGTKYKLTVTNAGATSWVLV